MRPSDTKTGGSLLSPGAQGYLPKAGAVHSGRSAISGDNAPQACPQDVLREAFLIDVSSQVAVASVG